LYLDHYLVTIQPNRIRDKAKKANWELCNNRLRNTLIRPQDIPASRKGSRGYLRCYRRMGSSLSHLNATSLNWHIRQSVLSDGPS